MRMSETGPTDPDTTLDVICHNVAQLCKTVRGPLRRIAVRSGEVTIEMEWPDALVASSPPPSLHAVPAETKSDEPDTHLHYISAPMVGTFYQAPEPGAKPFVSEGDVIEQGQQVGILEAMKLMNPIEADCRGRIVQILVPDGAAVEYGQHLIGLDVLDSSYGPASSLAEGL